MIVLGGRSTTYEGAKPESPPTATLAAATQPGQVLLTGSSLADMAQFIAGVAAESNSLPDWVQTRTASGRLQRLSATDAFVVLARAVSYWDSNARSAGERPGHRGSGHPAGACHWRFARPRARDRPDAGGVHRPFRLTGAGGAARR